jgi:hypothetical protein
LGLQPASWKCSCKGSMLSIRFAKPLLPESQLLPISSSAPVPHMAAHNVSCCHSWFTSSFTQLAGKAKVKRQVWQCSSGSLLSVSVPQCCHSVRAGSATPMHPTLHAASVFSWHPWDSCSCSDQLSHQLSATLVAGQCIGCILIMAECVLSGQHTLSIKEMSLSS